MNVNSKLNQRKSEISVGSKNAGDKKSGPLTLARSRQTPFVAICFSAGLLTCQSGVQAQSLTLPELYQKARAQDPQYRAAQRALAVGLEKLPQARAALLPSVNLSANKGRQFGDTSFSEAPFIARDVQSWSWTAQITQPLFRWANWVGWRQADAQVRQSLMQFALADQDLMLRSAQAYTDTVLAVQSLEVAKNQVSAMGEQVNLAERTFSVGTGTITDVQESRAKQALAQAQKVAAENDVEVKHAELEKLLGEPVVLPAMLSVDELTRQPHHVRAASSSELAPLSDWHAAAPKNLQVQLQEAALEVAREESEKSQALHMPTLDLVLGRSSSYNSGTLSSPADLSTLSASSSVSLQLTVPIYSGGATQSRVREALAIQEKVREELVFAQRNANAQVRQAYAGVISERAQVEALQAAVLAGRNAVESNKIGLKTGTRITPDLLTAEQQLFASMRDWYKARINAAMQHIKLKAAVGQLQPEDLQLTDLTLVLALNR